jgi:hypothetical protein
MPTHRSKGCGADAVPAAQSVFCRSRSRGGPDTIRNLNRSHLNGLPLCSGFLLDLSARVQSPPASLCPASPRSPRGRQPDRVGCTKSSFALDLLSITVAAQLLLTDPLFIFDHSASCASLFCCLLSASRLNCSFDHQAKHVSPIMNAETSPFCSSRRREVPLLITRWPRQRLM